MTGLGYCIACGDVTEDFNTGCIVCDLCDICTPNAGRCLDCADMRQENAADYYRRQQQENR